jgi:hypothetical protein
MEDQKHLPFFILCILFIPVQDLKNRDIQDAPDEKLILSILSILFIPVHRSFQLWWFSPGCQSSSIARFLSAWMAWAAWRMNMPGW